MNEKNKTIEFKAIINKSKFSSEDYKIYGVDVDTTKYENVKSNKKSEYIIVGNLPILVIGIEYEFKAKVEINKSFGIQYKVISVRRDKPTSLSSTIKFLNEVISPTQTEVLLEIYPDIIDRVMKNNLEDIDLNKLRGIKEFTFNNIKNRIVENFCLIDLVDEFGGLIEMNTIKKLYDKYPSPSIIKRKLKEDAYNCLCSLSRVGFKTADSVLTSLEEYSKKEDKPFFEYDLKTSIQRMKSCIDFILKENESNGNTKIDISNARKECGKLVPECITEFVNAIKNNEDIHLDPKTKTMATKTAYETELYISTIILEMLKVKNNIPWSIPIELYREVEGFNMTDEQMSSLNMMCENNVGILTAPAGSGKSASVQGFINMLEDNKKKYILMTPTGASSEVLQELTHRECGTIHRQLKYNPSSKDNAWGYNEENKLPFDVVIIDEFSMADIFLFRHVLEAIDIKKTKLLFVFDSFQLSSVSCGNVAYDLLISNVVPKIILTKIFRYDEGGLMQVVTNIRKSENFLPSDFSGKKIFGTKKDFIYIETNQTTLIDKVLKIYNKILNDGYETKDIMILSSQNKGEYGTKAINNHIQAMLQEKNQTKYIIRGNTKFHESDKVIQVINNYKAKGVYGEENINIFNGNSGTIVKVNYDELIVEFKNEKKIVYSKQNLDQLELGYAISTHRSQGGNAKQVIVVAPKAHTFMLNSNLLYVAPTRAKERVYMIGNINTINKAIKIKENFLRETYLESMLIDGETNPAMINPVKIKPLEENYNNFIVKNTNPSDYIGESVDIDYNDIPF